jgi:hypothetical protein
MRLMCTPKTMPGSFTGMEEHAALEASHLCSSGISASVHAKNAAI